MNSNKLQNILLKTMFYMLPITIFVVTYSYSISALANYIYTNTSASFLAHFSVTVHASKIEPINKKLIK